MAPVRRMGLVQGEQQQIEAARALRQRRCQSSSRKDRASKRVTENSDRDKNGRLFLFYTDQRALDADCLRVLFFLFFLYFLRSGFLQQKKAPCSSKLRKIPPKYSWYIKKIRDGTVWTKQRT